MDYIITKDELTSLADAIRRFDGTSGTLSYPNGFESAFDAALPWDFEGQDYDIVGGEGKIGEDTSNAKTMVIDWSSEILSSSDKQYYLNITSNFKTAYFPKCSQITIPLLSYSGSDYLSIQSIIAPEVRNITRPLLQVSKYLWSYPSVSIDFIYLPQCTSNLNTYYGLLSNMTIVSTINGTEVLNFQLSTVQNAYLPKCTSITAIQSAGKLEFLDLPIFSGSIPDGTFSQCYKLNEINISHCTHIGNSAFQNCSSLTTMNIPECSWIGADAFNSCTNLTSINFLNTQSTYIGSRAFKNCIGLSTLSLNCRMLYCEAFANCTGLTEVILNNLGLGNFSIFKGCTNLSNVILHYDMEYDPSTGAPLYAAELPASIFESCIRLTSITIPSEYSRINQYAFSGTGLESIIFEGSLPELGAGIFKSTKFTSFANNDLTVLPDQMFAYCSKLESINFPNVITINSQCFHGCSILSDINMPHLQTIGRYAFASCSNINNIELSQCTNISAYGFASCSFSQIDIPECAYLGAGAFQHNPLSSIIYNFSLISEFESHLFSRTQFESFSNSFITSIGQGCFAQCTSLKIISFPNCSFINTDAFISCYNLANCYIPKCISIGQAAFQQCSKLTQITLGENISFIGNWAFICCSNLINLTILNSTAVPTLEASYVFASTPMQGRGSGYIYVPSNLLSNYKKATNWAVYASHIKAIGT